MVSFRYGPSVLAAEGDRRDLVELFADDSRMGHVAGGPLRPLEHLPIVLTRSPADLRAGVCRLAPDRLGFALDHVTRDRASPSPSSRSPASTTPATSFTSPWRNRSASRCGERSCARPTRRHSLCTTARLTPLPPASNSPKATTGSWGTTRGPASPTG
ncbi:MAG: hypothetical protein JF597_37235 [Streptomyces sp.]|nr:hypothetical protein [Streptomyces sp.]